MGYLTKLARGPEFALSKRMRVTIIQADRRPPRGTLAPGPEPIDPDERIRALERQVAQLQRENAMLQRLARADALTGLANRRGFEEALATAAAHALRHDLPLSLMLIDLDGMKQLNDTCGHPAGDALLAEVGAILDSSIRRSDTAARFGGDEFAIVMPSTDAAGAETVAARIHDRIAALPLPAQLRASASIGISTLTAKSSLAESLRWLVARADAALYEAKQARSCNEPAAHTGAVSVSAAS